jgi:hypothetical protein
MLVSWIVFVELMLVILVNALLMLVSWTPFLVIAALMLVSWIVFVELIFVIVVNALLMLVS